MGGINELKAIFLKFQIAPKAGSPKLATLFPLLFNLRLKRLIFKIASLIKHFFLCSKIPSAFINARQSFNIIK